MVTSEQRWKVWKLTTR